MSEKFVLLLRHGIAEPKGTKDDEKRSLTESGNRRIKKIAAAIAELFADADAIYSSPLVRCVQTAQWVAKAYDSRLRVKELDSLRPGSDPAELREFLDNAAARNIIFVGHEPHLSATMLHLTRMHSDAEIELKKGGSYGVRIDGDGTASLEWMLPPRILRA